MEDLNKHQVVLLCLLLSFVTSIGTGVITFSLLSEAPPAVTQTINRVVEKTIERVVPVENQANVSQSIIKETIVVKEEDLIIDAVQNNISKIVRIKGVRAPEAESVFYGIGTIVKNDGMVVAPSSILEDGVLYSVQFENGKTIQVSSYQISQGGHLAFFKLNSDIKDLTFSSVVFADSKSLKLGQSVVVLGGEKTNVVTIARVASFGKSVSTTTDQFATLEIDVVPKDSAPGEALFNLDGEYVGIGMSRGATQIMSSDSIKQEIELFEETKK